MRSMEEKQHMIVRSEFALVHRHSRTDAETNTE